MLAASVRDLESKRDDKDYDVVDDWNNYNDVVCKSDA